MSCYLATEREVVKRTYIDDTSGGVQVKAAIGVLLVGVLTSL